MSKVEFPNGTSLTETNLLLQERQNAAFDQKGYYLFLLLVAFMSG